MELRHLRYFIAVAEELNFTKAAEKLCIVQPSLSKQIRDLEEEIGVTLFERDKRTVQLTNAGRGFLEHAYETIKSAERAIATAKQIILSNNKHTRIGFNPVAELIVAPHLISVLKNNGYQAEIKSLNCSDQIYALKSSNLDLTFTRFIINESEYDNLLIKQEALYLFCRNKNKEFDGSFNIKNLEDLQFISYSSAEAPILAEKTKILLKNNNLNPKNTIHCTNVFQLINLINSTDCWSIIPEYMIEFLKGNYDIKRTKEYVSLYANYRRRNNNEFLNIILPTLKQIHSSELFKSS